jgi:diguanylate cyclase (GGDEF)-like protein
MDVALAIAERLCTSLRSAPLDLGGPLLTVTGSFGVSSVVDAATTDYEHLLRRADLALYRAKERGRDQVVEADSE